jgi:hypothetical protein
MPISAEISDYFRVLQRKSVARVSPARRAHLSRIAKLPRKRTKKNLHLDSVDRKQFKPV